MAFYKFLRTSDGQALGPFSDHPWPLPEESGPGGWVEATGPLEVCGNGVHVCRPADLPHWLHDQLWEVQVAGEVTESDDKVVVERARLLARVEGWPALASAFSDDCTWSLRDRVVLAAQDEGLETEATRLAVCHDLTEVKEALGFIGRSRSRDLVMLAEFLNDAVAYAGAGEPAIVAFIAAHAADRTPRRPGHRLPRGMSPFELERQRQAAWLQANLGLA